MAKHPQEDLFAGTTMTFGEHLEELRVCLVRAIFGLVVGFLIGLLIANDVVRWIESPLMAALQEHYSKAAQERLQQEYQGSVAPEMIDLAADHGLTYEEVLLEVEEVERMAAIIGIQGVDQEATLNVDDLPPIEKQKLPQPSSRLVRTRLWRAAEAKITTLSPHESFMIYIKAAMVSGLVLACPYIFYQIWVFIAAGLYPHERRYVYVFLPFSLGLFLAGAALAFFFVFGPVLDFLFSFTRAMNIDPDLRISEVIGFVLILPLGFGVAFQLPLVMLFMNRIGTFTVAAYLEKWRIAILVIFVISMLLTPADPVSMMLMAVPLTVLYFLGIALCQWMPKGRSPFDEAYDPQ